MADSTNPGGWGKLGNGAAFLIPEYGNMPWFQYGGIKDQMKDASGYYDKDGNWVKSGWSSGGGVFSAANPSGAMGNNTPMMNTVRATPANVGGGLLGMSAYSGGPNPFLSGFNPYAGRGLNPGGPPGGGAPTPPGGTTPAPGALPPDWSGGFHPPKPPSPPATLTPTQPTGPGGRPIGVGPLPPPTPGDPGRPGNGSTGPAPGTRPGNGGTGVPTTTTGGITTRSAAANSGAGLLSGNWQAPQNPQQQAIRLAQSLNPSDNAALIALVGEQGAHQYANQYGPGGTNSNGNAIMDQYRAQNGGSQGIDTLMPAIRAMYEANGVIVGGKWAKKLDNNGNWVPI